MCNPAPGSSGLSYLILKADLKLQEIPSLTSSLTKLYHSLKWSYRCNKQLVEEEKKKKMRRRRFIITIMEISSFTAQICMWSPSITHIKQDLQFLVFCPSYLNFLYFMSLTAQNMPATRDWGSCHSVQNIVFWNGTSHNLVDSTNTLKGLDAFIFWVEEWASHVARCYTCRDRTIWTRASAVPILYILPSHPTKRTGLPGTWRQQLSPQCWYLTGKLHNHIPRNCHHN